MRSTLLFVAGLALSACSSSERDGGRRDDAPPSDDGSADGDGEPDGGSPLPPPDPPELTDWTCPEGWVATPVEQGRPWEFRACVPPDHQRCEGASAQWPGETDCTPIGPPCPPEPARFPPEEQLRARAAQFAAFDGPVVYVDPDAEEGGDGGRETPFRHVIDILPLKPPGQDIVETTDGTIVALSRGTHMGRVRLATRVAVLGACAEQTIVSIDPRGADTAPTTTHMVGTGGSLMADLTVRDVDRPGVSVHRNAEPVRLQSVLVERATGAAVLFGFQSNGGEVRDVVIRDTLASEGIGRALVMQQLAGPVKVQRAVVSGSHEIGVYAGADVGAPAQAPVILEDLVVAATAPLPDGTRGWAVAAEQGSDVTIRRCLVQDFHEVGVFAHGEAGDGGSVVVLEDVAVRDMQHTEGGRRGSAIAASGNATVTARRVAVHGALGGGFTAWTDDLPEGQGRALMDLQDVWIRSVAPLPDPRTSGTTPAGIGALWGAEVTAKRVVVDDAAGIGVLAGTVANRAAPKVTLTDAVVVRGRPMSGATEDPELVTLGVGVVARSGTSLTATRLHVQGSTDGGVVIWGCTGVPGLPPLPGCTEETRADLRHLSVLETAAAPCGSIPTGEPGSCIYSGDRNFGQGHGIMVLLGASASLGDVLIQGAQSVGLAVAHGSRIEGDRLVVSHNAVGTLLPSAAEDPDGDAVDLGDQVFVFDNDTDVSREELLILDPRVFLDEGI